MRRIIVGVSDAQISDNREHVITTYSLGSCIGVCLYDPIRCCGGMLHFQLPDSHQDQSRADERPLMFADTGMKILIASMVNVGADKSRFVVSLAGGAAMSIGPKGFDIGKRNHTAIRKILWKHGMFIDKEEVGEDFPRNMHLNVADGVVVIEGKK